MQAQGLDSGGEAPRHVCQPWLQSIHCIKHLSAIRATPAYTPGSSLQDFEWRSLILESKNTLAESTNQKNNTKISTTLLLRQHSEKTTPTAGSAQASAMIPTIARSRKVDTIGTR